MICFLRHWWVFIKKKIHVYGSCLHCFSRIVCDRVLCMLSTVVTCSSKMRCFLLAFNNEQTTADIIQREHFEAMFLQTNFDIINIQIAVSQVM